MIGSLPMMVHYDYGQRSTIGPCGYREGTWTRVNILTISVVNTSRSLASGYWWRFITKIGRIVGHYRLILASTRRHNRTRSWFVLVDEGWTCLLIEFVWFRRGVLTNSTVFIMSVNVGNCFLIFIADNNWWWERWIWFWLIIDESTLGE